MQRININKSYNSLERFKMQNNGIEFLIKLVFLSQKKLFGAWVTLANKESALERIKINPGA